MKKPVAVTHDKGTKIEVVGRFNTIVEAEACIVGLMYYDKASVEAGCFGIDAPETMVNPKEKQ